MAIVLVFHEGMRFGFLPDWDDANFIQNNPRLAFSWENLMHYAAHPFQELYTPLPMWSLMLDYAMFGLSPLGYHLHNLALHVLGAWMLLAVLRKMGVRPALAALGALLWALNPQKVESVVWLSERKDVLCGMLSFAAMWCFLNRWAWRCALCTALAIFAKPAAVALPGVYLVWHLAGLAPGWRKWPVCPVAAGIMACVVSMLMTGQTNPGRLESALLVPIHNLFWYPLASLVPFETNPIYPEVICLDAHFLGVLLGGMALLGAGVALARRLKCPWRKIWGVLLILGGTMLPVLGLLHYTNFRYCDRYNYLVSAVMVSGAMVLAEMALRRWPRKHFRRVLLGGLAGMAIGYGCLTYLYVPYWENCLKLSYCSLQRPGRPNLKAYEMGTMAAFRHGAKDYLDYLRGELQRRPPLTRFDREASIRSYLLFMETHEAFMAGQYAAAEAAFRQLAIQFAQSSQGEDVVVPLPPTLIQWLYADMVEIALRQGNLEKAEFYRSKIHP